MQTNSFLSDYSSFNGLQCETEKTFFPRINFAVPQIFVPLCFLCLFFSFSYAFVFVFFFFLYSSLFILFSCATTKDIVLYELAISIAFFQFVDDFFRFSLESRIGHIPITLCLGLPFHDLDCQSKRFISNEFAYEAQVIWAKNVV
jgi:hypothetical protein